MDPKRKEFYLRVNSGLTSPYEGERNQKKFNEGLRKAVGDKDAVKTALLLKLYWHMKNFFDENGIYSWRVFMEHVSRIEMVLDLPTIEITIEDCGPLTAILDEWQWEANPDPGHSGRGLAATYHLSLDDIVWPRERPIRQREGRALEAPSEKELQKWSQGFMG
ncbi:MAG: hypothetical protein WC761_05685 [Candidatus Paceibacterota bacterium]|jgi:hypothetical protein